MGHDAALTMAAAHRPRSGSIDSHAYAAVRALARRGAKLAAKIGAKRTAVRDRSRAAGRRLRALTRSMRRRSGHAKAKASS